MSNKEQNNNEPICDSIAQDLNKTHKATANLNSTSKTGKLPVGQFEPFIKLINSNNGSENGDTK